jgi:hypothetical protein
MYKIEKTSYGFHTTFGGTLKESEVRQYAAEIDVLRQETKRPYSVIIDIRNLVPPEPGVLEILKEAQARARECGMQRMSILGQSPIIKSQALQFVFLTDSADMTRYINTSKVENWDKLGLDWAVNGIEPMDDVLSNSGQIHIG